ncbi:MAG: hypothetical protein M3Q17_05705 [Actinomycetota bacterium]|nr:hypothetical protein [Actinomycetota bacterium]
MSKISMLAAAAVGYVLGARAGRDRYDQISEKAHGFWENPKVRQAAADAKDVAAEQAPVVKDKITDAASKVADKTTGKTNTGSRGSSSSASKRS